MGVLEKFAGAHDVVLQACNHPFRCLAVEALVRGEGVGVDGVVGEGVQLGVEAVDVPLNAGEVDGAAVGGAEGCSA